MKCRFVLRMIGFGVALWIAGHVSAMSATRHVVLLFDERLSLSGLADIDADFVRTLRLRPTDDIEVYRETMDLSRFGSENYERHLSGFLREKYASKKIDVVVAVFGPALNFLLKHGSAIFPGALTVFCGIDRRELAGRSLPPDVRGVLLKREFAPTLDLVLKLHPETKQIVVVAGTSAFDAAVLDQARHEFSAYQARIAIRYLTASPLKQLLTELAQLPSQTVILFTTMFRDGAGQPLTPYEAVAHISAAAAVPVYGFNEQYLGRGIVGGSLYGVAALGAETARVVLRILAGEERSEPPWSEPSIAKVMFDWRQLQRWSISAQDLPIGSEIRFRDSPRWQQYWLQILAVVAVLLAQSALIAWLLYEHRKRNVAEVLARTAMAELTHMNRIATAGELSASIAHEVSQPLATIATGADTALNWLAANQPNLEEARSALAQISNASHRAAGIIRNLRAMFGKEVLQREPVDVNGVISAVLKLTRLELETHEIKVEVELDSRPCFVMGVGLQLQQVVFNLVVNAVEAMDSELLRSRKLRVTTELVTEHVHISIEDSGPGIPRSDLDRVFQPMFTTKAQGMGLGLAICRSIIEAHDGRIWVVRGDTGSNFRITLPRA